MYRTQENLVLYLNLYDIYGAQNMHKKSLLIVVILILIPLVSYAFWQIADPVHGARYDCDRSTTSGFLNNAYPRRYLNGSAFSFELRRGTLKGNVLRLAKKYNWQVRWFAPNKYCVALATRIVGPTFPILMNQLLSHYPIRATYDVKYQRMKVYYKR